MKTVRQRGVESRPVDLQVAKGGKALSKDLFGRSWGETQFLVGKGQIHYRRKEAGVTTGCGKTGKEKVGMRFYSKETGRSPRGW